MYTVEGFRQFAVEGTRHAAGWVVQCSIGRDAPKTFVSVAYLSGHVTIRHGKNPKESMIGLIVNDSMVAKRDGWSNEDMLQHLYGLGIYKIQIEGYKFVPRKLDIVIAKR